MKRTAADYSVAAPATKVQNTGPPAGQGETWSCLSCGNVNWPLRTVCNRKECGALGPWTCPVCSNQNYQGRAVCNRKGCSQSHPSNSAVVAAAVAGKVVPGMPGLQALLLASSGAPAGSWLCTGCNNINWPLRSNCNNKVCGLPRSQADGGPVSHRPGLGGVGSGIPSGSWVCTGCQNINWPLRTTCNNKTCGLPREQVDGGPPPIAVSSTHGIPGMNPAGSWTCTVCGNTNWPLRQTCNNKSCGLPRDQVDGGTPQVSNNGANATTPVGSWSCPLCGNINWPLRTVCNKKGCNQPKPI